MSAPDNPLLSPGLPRFGSIEPAHALPAIEQLVDSYRSVIEEITSLAPEEIDYDNTLWAEALADETLSNAWSTIGHLNRVTNTEAWRDAFQACLPIISAFATERSQNQALCQVYQTLADRSDLTEQPQAIQAAIEHNLRDFKLSGVDQSQTIRDALKEKSLRLSELSNAFGNHVMDATDGFQLHFESTDKLQGLPDDALAQMADRAKANEKDGWLADLSLPSYKAIMTYADDRDLREQFYHAFSTRASDQGPQAGEFDNTPLVTEMLAIRHEMADLLGFDHHARHRLETRMAESVEAIESFLTDLANRARPMAETQLQALNDFAATKGAEVPLKPWDVAYYTEQLKEETLGINDELLKPYFEVEAVFGGLFATAEKLFGLQFEKEPNPETWHEHVSFYHVNKKEGQRMAGLYLDIYARPKKAGGAWMDVCRSRLVKGEIKQLPIAYLTCNFAPPSEGRPSLLTHDDVVTLFHEFGHCLHHLLTEVDLPMVAGIHGVEWDAVELPSQLLEGWSMAQDALNTYARHIQTNEPLPSEDLNALRESRQFQGALALLRQIQFALTDLKLHQQAPADPIAIAREVEETISVMPSPTTNRFLMSFSHLFNGGYSAGYYSYLWAERLARDAFDLFETHGIYDADLGQRLANSILSMGGSRPMQVSWMEFAGREPRLEPLLRAYGIEGMAA